MPGPGLFDIDVKRWEPKDVREWIKLQKFPEKQEQHLIDILGQYDGSTLAAIDTKKDLQDIGVSKAFCPGALKKIKELKAAQSDKKQSEFDRLVEENDNEQHNETEFYVTFDASESKMILSNKKFKLTDKLIDLKNYWVEHERGGDVKELDLIFGGKVYSLDKNDYTLEKMGMTSRLNLVGILWKTQGGSNSNEKDEKLSLEDDPLQRERHPQFKSEKRIKPSQKPDCLMGYDEDDELRVEMPCGHVYAPVTIYQITDRVFKQHQQYQVRCPMLKCGVLWDFGILAAAGDFNGAESTRFQRIFNKREAVAQGDTQMCPSCKTLTKRPADLSQQRVKCTNGNCKAASDFCWVCGQDWVGGGFRVCGNKNCATAQINEQLANSDKTTEMWCFNGIEIPILRACPHCTARIQHNEHCKHMKCNNCKTEFCFVCLSVKKDGQWTCADGKGDYDEQCKLAPVQIIK